MTYKLFACSYPSLSLLIKAQARDHALDLKRYTQVYVVEAEDFYSAAFDFAEDHEDEIDKIDTKTKYILQLL